MTSLRMFESVDPRHALISDYRSPRVSEHYRRVVESISHRSDWGPDGYAGKDRPSCELPLAQINPVRTMRVLSMSED
jgi:hypothetical protein